MNKNGDVSAAGHNEISYYLLDEIQARLSRGEKP
jgi:hypothetical protein